MKGMIAWFAGNSVAANLLMGVILVGGLVTGLTIKTELFPEFSLDHIQISVLYPGAAPEEVEEAVCVRIEEEIHAVDGIDRITSTAAEGNGTVLVKVLPGEDARRILDDIKTRVDAIDTFPVEAEKPIIRELVMRRQVINLAVAGDADEAVLKRIAEQVRDDLSATDGISQVQLAGARPYEVSLELSEEALRRYGLTFSQVAEAVRRSSLDLSGGSVKTDGGEVLLRTKGQAYRAGEFEDIVVWTQPDGTRVHVGDVAQVVDGFEDTDQLTRFNGKPAVMVQVYRVGEQNALELAEAVHAYIETARASLPEGIELVPWADAAVFLRSRLNLLLRNGLQGLVLVFAVLALFLRFRLAFWVTLGIPISFMGALWLLPSLDSSINMLSLFAFIVVLGIVVDDAIVVGENIFSEQKRGLAGLEGAVRGAQRVAMPVTFAVLTTAVAFTPMLNLPGTMGKFFKVIPLVVIPTLLFSWIESKMILPAHLAHQGEWGERLARRRPFSWWVSMQGAFERGLERFAAKVYLPVLERALEWRYVSVALALAAMMVTIGLVRGGFVKFVFFNPIEGDIVSAQLTMPLGTAAHSTAEAVRRIEAATRELRDELDATLEAGQPSIVRHYIGAIGEQPHRAQQQNSGAGGSAFVGSHLGEVILELLPAEERDITSTEVVRRWRELTGPIPDAVELLFTSDIMSAGDAINVQLVSDDVEDLRLAAAELKRKLAEFPGVFDIADSFRGGKQEIQFDILPAAEALGLTQADLARQVRQGFYGEEAQRIQRGRDDVKVMVRYPKDVRRSLYALDSMRIRTADGGEVPLGTVSATDVARGYAKIERSDRRRTVRVTADVDRAAANVNDILAVLTDATLPAILDRYPGVGYEFEGENKEQAETVASLTGSFLLALLAIYALMAIPFKSYVQPAIVMVAVPFGLIGAVLGHLLLGIALSVLSLCGLVALTGVVVNDSLVLVHFVNRRREEGQSAEQAARTAGVQRFRPIILTSLTTFAGLTPLLLEKSVQAQFMIPMAVSLAYGVLFSTLISLLLVPVTYLVLEDLLAIPRWLAGRSRDSLKAERSGV